MGFGNGAFALVAGCHRRAPQFGQLLKLPVGLGLVDAVAGDNHRPAGCGHNFHGPGNILRRALRLCGVQVAGGVVDKGRRFHIHLAADSRRAHYHRRRAGAAAGGVLDRQLRPQYRLFGAGGYAGIFGHSLDDGRQVNAAVFPGPGLVGRMLGRTAVGSVGQHQHRGTAEHRLHNAETGVGTDKQPLAHHHGRLAGGPAIDIGHYRRRLLVAAEDGLYPLLAAHQQVVNLAGAAAGNPENILNAGLLEGLHD